MNNYDEKITLIKENQKKMLEMVKDKLISENQVFNMNTKNVVELINCDFKVVKKYEAIIKAQKLIEEYTEAITNATSVEDIIEIRKKLNSSINKIKKEMKTRGIDDIEYNNYCEKAKDIRKIISQNIRFLKREEKINEINTLYSNFDNLNEEELLRLKKLIKNEVSYGKRNLSNGLVIERKKPAIIEEKKLNIFGEKTTVSEEKKPTIGKIVFPEFNGKSAINIESYDTLEDFVGTRVYEYEKVHSIANLGEYNTSLIKNIKVFICNMPKLLKNKKEVKKMIAIYCSYLRKPEFKAYIEFTKRNNSVSNNLKKVVKKGVLKDKENYYKEEHEKIVDWIIEFCKNNHMEIRYNRTKTV